MGFLQNQLSNVVEWNQTNPNDLFWKWQNQELKKGSVLFIRPGQDAIFLYNGAVEGVFEDDGKYDIESQIIPFLSTLKGFKFGFNSGMRAEVLFVNTKEVICKWGTKNPINLQTPLLPGGMPIRAFGTFTCKIADRAVVIEKLAGIQQSYGVEDVKERIMSSLDMLVMQWVAKEGKDMFNLQIYAKEIAEGIRKDLDYEMSQIGISITSFKIESFSYPEEVKKMQEKAAAQAMVGDVGKYTTIAAADSMSNANGGSGHSVAGDMVQMQMGMMMGQQMMNNMNMNVNQGQTMAQAAPAGAPFTPGAVPNFCPVCGAPTNGANFCGNCGNKLA